MSGLSCPPGGHTSSKADQLVGLLPHFGEKQIPETCRWSRVAMINIHVVPKLSEQSCDIHLFTRSFDAVSPDVSVAAEDGDLTIVL